MILHMDFNLVSIDISGINKKIIVLGGIMAQQIKVLAAEIDDLNLTFRVYMVGCPDLHISTVACICIHIQ